MQRGLLFYVWLPFLAAPLTAQPPGSADWVLAQLDTVGGHPTTRVGAPRLTDTPGGPAIEFDGQSAIFLDVNPLAGLKQFTVEVVFQPHAKGAKEQRFLHFQEKGSENRLLFETRLTDDNRWFLDTFLKSGDGNYTLFASQAQHPIGPWYHAAVTMDGSTFQHFVNGTLELSTAIRFEPQQPGRTSIGVRLNQVSWYRGAVRRIRITPRVLAPREFLQP